MSDRLPNPFLPDPELARKQREARLQSARIDLNQPRLRENPFSLDDTERLARERAEVYGLYTRDDLAASGAFGVAQQSQSPIRSAVGGALRGIASSLEPLQLPQDVFFAALAGALDGENTILGNLRQIQWGRYAPGGLAPERVADGGEILGLLGVQDERAKRWGGILMDLTVDPLLFGSALRVAGKLSKVEELVRFGNVVDDVTSVGGLYRKAREASPAFSGFVDDRVEGVLKALRDPDGTIFGLGTERVRALAQGVLPKRTAAKIFGGALGESLAAERALGTQKAQDVLQDALLDLERLEGTLIGKEDAVPFLRKAFGIIGGLVPLERKVTQETPEILGSFMKREAYTLVQRRGLALATEEALEAAPNLPRGFEDFLDTSLPVFAEKPRAFDDFEASVRRVRSLASKEGLNADDYERRFREFVQGVTITDAKLGFHLSGYDFTKQKVMARIAEVTGSPNLAEKFWGQALEAGMLGQWDQLMQEASGIKPLMLPESDFRLNLLERRSARASQKTAPLQAELEGLRRTGVKLGEGGNDVGPKTSFTPEVEKKMRDLERRIKRINDEVYTKDFTYGELLGNEVDAFSPLKIGKYLHGLANGHLRRAFGMFMDENNFRNYIRAHKNGKVVSNNILDDGLVSEVLADTPVAAAAIIEYRQILERAGETTGTGAGLVMTKFGLARHIAERAVEAGASKREAGQMARSALARLNKALTNTPAMRNVITQIEEAGQVFLARERGEFGGTFGRGFFKARNLELEKEQLDILGEFVDPLVSLTQSATAARIKLPVATFLQESYDLGVTKGAVKSRAFTDETGVRYLQVREPPEVLGAFSGKYVHPYLYNEITKAIRLRGTTNRTFDRIRSLLTGGYLAAPNVVAANFFGGIYTAAAAGISPSRMLVALAQTALPLGKDGGREYELLQRLRKHVPIEQTSVVTQDVARSFEKLQLDAAGVGPEGFRKTVSTVAKWWEDQLRAPLGQRWAGLSGFQFVEKWLKTAAFKSEFDRLVAEAGGDVARLAPDVLDNIERQAAEIARISVFDYSELPEYVEFLRDYGVLMFPGFPLFMVGRTLNAAINRPGVLAASDRVSEALMNANLDPEEAAQAYLGMPDWLKNDQGSPIKVVEDKEGNERVSVIPLNQLIPTEAFFQDRDNPFANPLADSLGVGGLWRPLIEVINALASGTGEAPLSERFGGQVFTPETGGLERAGQVFGFLYNNLAPSTLRKAVRFDPRGQPDGILPKLVLPREMVTSLVSYDEARRRKADRDVWDEVIGTFLRSPQKLALTGRLAAVRAEYARAKQDFGLEISALRKRFERARARNDVRAAERFRSEMVERQRAFNEKWREFFRIYREGGAGG